jgi:hypothetical protein
VTGVSFLLNELGAKRLELLRELVPAATSVGFLANPTRPSFQSEVKNTQQAAQALGVKLIVLNASTLREVSHDAGSGAGMSSTLRTTSFNTTYEAWIYRAIISVSSSAQRHGARRPDRLRARFDSADGSGSRNASRKPAAVASSVVAANWLARRFIKCVRLQLRQDASMVIMGQC